MILLLTVISIAVVVITIVFDMIYQNTSIPDFVAPKVTQPNERIFKLNSLLYTFSGEARNMSKHPIKK